MASGFLDATLQPLGLLAAAASRAGRRPHGWGRLPAAGLPELRSHFAAETGAALTGQDVLITTGGQAALSAVFRHLCAPGDPVIVESPTYVGALAAARAAGLILVPVPGDRDGVLPDALADALARSGARLALPAAEIRQSDRIGAGPGAPRRGPGRGSQARRVRRRGRLGPRLRSRAAITAAAGHDGRRRPRDLPAVAIQADRRGPAGGRARRPRAGHGQAAPRPDQRRPVRRPGAAADRARCADGRPAGPRHLGSVRRVLRERRDALAGSGQHAPARLSIWRSFPRGGLHLWLRLPDRCSDADVTQACAARGLAVSPGRSCFAGEPPGSVPAALLRGRGRRRAGPRHRDPRRGTGGQPSYVLRMVTVRLGGQKLLPGPPTPPASGQRLRCAASRLVLSSSHPPYASCVSDSHPPYASCVSDEFGRRIGLPVIR